MSAFGIDYAWSKPTTAVMKAAGVKFIARYLSNDPSKNLTRSEATAANDAGIWCVVVWETTAARALDGRSAGVTDAGRARDQAAALGMPDDRPIYFAVDFDAQPSQYAAIKSYFDGVASVLGRDRVGMYAGYYPITWAFDNRIIEWGWQTYAWSGGQWDTRAHIQQYKNGVVLGGSDVDYNRAMYGDYGQWMIGESPVAISDADAKKIATAVAKTDGLYPAPYDSATNPEWKLEYHIYYIGKTVRQIAAAVAGLQSPDVDEAAIVAGVLTGLDPEKLAEAISGHMGVEVATSVLDALKARLES